MAGSGFLAKHRLKRHAIRKDLLCFGIPAFTVFCAGLVFSVGEGWEGLPRTVWRLVRDPSGLARLPLQSIIGPVLILAGFTILFVSVGTLRRFYASTLVIREGHQLVTHGIYRFSRHPIYLGVIMIAFGVPAYVSSVLGLVTMSALVPIFLGRIKLEEGLLIEEFGDAYRTYRRTTGKLIPFVH